MAWRIFLTLIACGSIMACNSDNANAVKVNTTPEPVQSESVEAQTVDDSLSESESESESEILTQSATEPECDLESVNLLDFVPWQREEGWWVGEYTFLGADGDPNVSASWPYRYDHYRGFIHLEVIGNSIKQRNVFLYPAKNSSECDSVEDVVGSGICGDNGNEKVFSADQSASDCDGNLSGPFEAFGMTLSTTTTLIGDDTVLYQVRLPDGSFTQNQLTTLPPNDTRVRTAQGFFMGASTYASYYRERKVTKEEFVQLLEETRQEYNILELDYCGYDSGGSPSNVSCDEHFGVALGD
ncbi:hypothetical protein [Photobacterium angustum]|uniref:hypothetical protein n=1 Tax=Photobacterium angustum TaxID=661 RepID=UPI0005E849F6|nr:hypothetical protein [Photobacterium angustum]KJF94079.1 hypothetical protein UB39_12830 [Photobacterium angustum]PSW76331.1 hypothetical protein CTN03_21980 [Photobacterium angustum]